MPTIKIDITKLVQRWQKNCGIGPGGFQPGNTCARGGGWSPAGKSGKDLTDEEMEVVREGGIKSRKQFDELRQLLKPTTPDDLEKDEILLWHGTSLSGAKGIIKSGQIGSGQRGRNATADIDHASQYPEDTGADALVLVRARTKELDVDPNDQIGSTVREGLFPNGFGSSATIGSHSVAAVFDMRTETIRDEAFNSLKSGDLYSALESGATVLYFRGDKKSTFT